MRDTALCKQLIGIKLSWPVKGAPIDVKHLYAAERVVELSIRTRTQVIIAF